MLNWYPTRTRKSTHKKYVPEKKVTQIIPIIISSSKFYIRFHRDDDNNDEKKNALLHFIKSYY